MSTIFKPPTTVRTKGLISKTGQYLTARLCELGYNVSLDGKYRHHPVLSTFYNIIWDYSTVRSYDDFLFSCADYSIEFHPIALYKAQNVELDDFINFSIFCWGLHRGNRLDAFFADPIIAVDKEIIAGWKLTNLI